MRRFAIYISTVTLLIIISYIGILPPEIAQYVNISIPGISGTFFTVDAAYFEQVINITRINLGVSFALALLASIFMMRKRNFFEFLGVLVAGMLPKQRTYWGVISDEETGQPIPFAPIRIWRVNSDGAKQAIIQTVTDLDGRYRLVLKEQLGQSLLQIEAPGYHKFEHEINPTSLDRNTWVVIEDVTLTRLNDITDAQSVFWLEIRPKVYTFLFWGIFITTFLQLPLGIFATLNNPVLVSILFLIVYTVSNISNFRVARDRLRPQQGRVISQNYSTPVAQASIEIFKAEQKILSVFTDQEGLAHFDIPAGDYMMKVSSTIFANPNLPLMPIKITAEGFLATNIFVETKEVVEDQQSGENQLSSPFGN